MAKRSLPVRLLRGFGILLVLVIVVVVAFVASRRHAMPENLVAGPEAEALAHDVEKALNMDAWEKTGAVRWNFWGINQHLWDRRRNFERFRHGDEEVLINLNDKSGLAWKNHNPVSGEAGKALIQKAWGMFINDSFWLAAPYKLFDSGTTRFKTEVDGAPAVLVKYESGGVTPGDSYLWILGPDHRPTAWRLWVSIFPVKGVEASWEDWQTTQSGAVISTMHRLSGLPMVRIKEVETGASLSDLEPGGDPFDPLIKSTDLIR